MAKLTRKEYESQLRRLQTELCHLQTWVKLNGCNRKPMTDTLSKNAGLTMM